MSMKNGISNQNETTNNEWHRMNNNETAWQMNWLEYEQEKFETKMNKRITQDEQQWNSLANGIHR